MREAWEQIFRSGKRRGLFYDGEKLGDSITYISFPIIKQQSTSLLVSEQRTTAMLLAFHNKRGQKTNIGLRA